MAVTPHDRILDTATRLLLEEGIRAVGMSRIAAEAGVAPMTIYRQFGSKERLVAAVVEDWSSRTLRWLAADELHASLLTRVAAELRGRANHPAHKTVEAHRVAMRQLLEEMAGRAGAVNPLRVAGQLMFLVEGAAVVKGWPAGAEDVRSLADAALVAASAR